MIFYSTVIASPMSSPSHSIWTRHGSQPGGTYEGLTIDTGRATKKFSLGLLDYTVAQLGLEQDQYGIS